MSKMGEAARWVQEQGLENDPLALSKFLKYKYGLNKKPDSGTKGDTDGGNGESQRVATNREESK